MKAVQNKQSTDFMRFLAQRIHRCIKKRFYFTILTKINTAFSSNEVKY